MNQAASATRRSPAGSIAAAGCCPMPNAPFFVNTFAPQAPLLPPHPARPCYLGAQGSQHAQVNANQRPQQQGYVLPTQTPINSLSSDNQSRQTLSQHPQDDSNNLNTSLPTSNLSIQHLLTSRAPNDNCLALAAAALATRFPQLQHHQLTQNRQTHINPASSTSTSNVVHSINPTPNTFTNQVPLLSFNSYSSLPPFLNLSTQAVSSAAAHMNSVTSIHQQQQPNNITSAIQTPTSNPPVSNNASTESADSQGAHQHRPLLNSSVNQHRVQNMRNLQPTTLQQQQHQTAQLTQVQQLGQLTRNLLNDEVLNSIFNDPIHNALILNHMISSSQLASHLTAQSQQPQAHQITTPQAPSTRPQTLPSTGQVSVVMSPAQQTATQNLTEQVSENSQAFQQLIPHNRMPIQPAPSVNSSSGIFQSRSSVGQTNQQNQATQNSVPLSGQQTQQGSQSSSTAQQPTQHSTLPPIPNYNPVHMGQAMTLLAASNPQIVNTILNQMFTMYFQPGFRPEANQAHGHHHPSHIHHHLHGAQHHHHHGPNGPGNGQDSTMPLDSLAINETKPRGLNRAEIDSLTPYIHLNEKDTKTCVICLSKFELKSKIRPLPCNHAFHAKCVDKWLRANRTCPICRRDALKTYNAKIKRI